MCITEANQAAKYQNTYHQKYMNKQYHLKVVPTKSLFSPPFSHAVLPYKTSG